MSDTRNVVIDFSTKCVNYHITLSSKVTIIKGHSGIGKTYLIDQLSSVKDGRSEKSEEFMNLESSALKLHVSNGYHIVILPNAFDFAMDYPDFESGSLTNQELRKFDKMLSARFKIALEDRAKVYKDVGLDRIIFMGDEDATYVNYKAFQRTIREVPSLFVFVNRNALFSVPCDCNSVRTLETSGITTTDVPYFDNKLRGLNNSSLEYNKVFCEDSLTGLKIFKEIVSNSDFVDAFGGKDYLLNYWNQHMDSLFILDSLGCGATLDRLLDLIQEGKIHNQNGVYLIGSFEHMLLTSEFAKRGNAKSGFVLREPAINEWNVEEFYAKELYRFCVEALKMRMGYHKKDLASCFVEACKSSVEDCKGLLDLTQSSCDYKVPGTLQDKLKTLIPADLYQVLINLKGDSKLTCNQSQVKQSQSQDSAKLSEQPDINSGKTNSEDSESDITTNLFGC